MLNTLQLYVNDGECRCEAANEIKSNIEIEKKNEQRGKQKKATKLLVMYPCRESESTPWC